MKYILPLLLLFFLNGCSISNQFEPFNKVQNTKLPHYSSDKANLYFLNNETTMLMNIDYDLIFHCNDVDFPINVNYSQYSYLGTDEGQCKIYISQADKNHLFGHRDDFVYFELDVKAGETYILKASTSADAKTYFKLLFAVYPINNLIDPKVSLVLIDNTQGAIEINDLINWYPIVGKRLFPARADGRTRQAYLRDFLKF